MRKHSFILLLFLVSTNISAQLVSPKFYLKSDLRKKEFSLKDKEITVEFKGFNKNPELENFNLAKGNIESLNDSTLIMDVQYSSLKVSKGGKMIEEYSTKFCCGDNMLRLPIPVNSIQTLTISGDTQESLQNLGAALTITGFVSMVGFSIIAAVKNDNVPIYASKGLGYSLIGASSGIAILICTNGKKISFTRGGPWRFFER